MTSIDALPLAPTGPQTRLVHGAHEAVTVGVAAGLRVLRLDGRDVLDGFEEHERPVGGRGQTLLPWPNRVDGGRYELDGATQQLALTEPAAGNAIHGLARWVVWDVEDRTPSSVTYRTVVVPQPGWPTLLLCRVTYALEDAGLTVTTSARNVGTADCLYGTGSHPYLTAGTALVDDATVQVPASSWYETDDRGLPVATHPVDGSPYDLRELTRIGDRRLDTCFGELTPDDDGRWRVRLGGPDGEVVVWGDETHRWVQLFTGDTLDDAHRRRGLAVEPMTCTPDAFNAADPKAAGVVRLAPGQEHISRWGFSAT